MSNTLLTPTQVLREALRVLHNNLVFVKKINKGYSKEFAIEGAKVGTTVNVRLPNQYYVSKQTALQAQNTNETTVPVTLTTNYQVGLNFTQNELTLSLDDFSKRILTPAMATLASRIDYDGLALAADSVYNIVGTAGTTPGTSSTFSGSDENYDYTSPAIFLNAGAKMSSFAAPKDRRGIVVNPVSQARSVAGLSGLLNDQASVGDQYINGSIGHALGFDFAEDQNVNVLTVGTRAGSHGVGGHFSITQTNVTGDTNLYVTWASDSNTNNTIVQGEVVNVAGVYSVNPENQQSTGLLQDFVVTATTTMPTAGTQFPLPVSPSIIVAGSQIANGTVNALPTSSAVVTIRTSASATTAVASAQFPQNIAYHPDFMTLATADLEMPRGVDFAARETYDGISILIVRAYDINNAQFSCRLDVLAGWAILRAMLACRITG